MQIYRKSLYFLRINLDIIFIIISFFISASLSFKGYNFFKNTNSQFLLLILLVVWFFSGRTTGLYDEFRSRNYSYELILLIKNIIIQIIGAILILFLLKEESLSRGFVFLYALFLLVLLMGEKYLVRHMLYRLRVGGRNLRNLLIIGAGDVGRNFFESVLYNPHFGYKIIGFLDDVEKAYLNGLYLGKINDLDELLAGGNIDDIIIALPNYATDRIEDVIKTCERYTTRVRIIPDYFRFVSSKYNVSMFGRFPIISVREDRINELHWRMLKRSFDTLFTSVLFVFVFSWLWPLIGLLIKIYSPGPVFFVQERWGRDNEKFITYKFRSMSVGNNDVDENGSFMQATQNDPRITPIGRILRKTNLDELPQFWNVLKGEMSIVGPRPHPIPLNLESKESIHLYMLRHLVKPGITGWAQVNGLRGETKDDVTKMQKRIDHDIWYIENWTFLLDLQIIILTVWKMIKGDPNAY